jgi:AraC-like DNA-binding protein
MYVVMNDLLGDGLPLRRMEFKIAPPSYAAGFGEIFGVEPLFGRPANLMVFDSAELERPLPQSNSHTLSICEAQCRALVTRRRARTGIAHDVRERLIRVNGAPAGIDEVAEGLNMSVRTLRRRLTEAGTSYRELLDEVRHALAEELLGTTPLSVSDVAVRLGYGESSSFIYAFKRWTGTTPAAFQRGRRAAAAGVRRSPGSV